MIREAAPDDLGAITDIYNEAILEGGFTGDLEPLAVAGRRGWFSDHDGKYAILVHCIDGSVVGYVALSPYRKGRRAFDRTCELSYYVFAKCRGRGIGTNLIQAALARAREAGFRTVLAIVLACNPRSIDLLERFGFVVCGRLPGVARIAGATIDHIYLSRCLELADVVTQTPSAG